MTDEELRGFLAGPYRRIVDAVRLVTGSRAAAEDAVHEALARAWERRGRIDHLDRWVVTVALNVARSRWRKLRREVYVADGTAVGPPAGPTDPVAAAVDIERALQQIPRRQREVAVLHYVLDLRIADIAELLGLSEGGVKHALHSARRSLAKALAYDEEEAAT